MSHLGAEKREKETYSGDKSQRSDTNSIHTYTLSVPPVIDEQSHYNGILSD